MLNSETRDLDALKNQIESLQLSLEKTRIELAREQRQHKETKSSLFNEKQRAQITLNAITDSVITTDSEGTIQFMNPAAYKLASIKKKEVPSHSFSEVFQLKSIESRDPVTDLVTWCLESENKRCPAIEFILKIKSGREHLVEAMLSALVDVDGYAYGVVILIRDISSYKNLNSELSYLANHDMLTGLINRREFESRLGYLLEDSRLSDRQHILFYLDLDHFKEINDQCGHAAGDEVLKEISKIFRVRLRKEDCIARLGGDEFGVTLMNCGVDNAKVVAEKIRQDIEEFRFQWQREDYRLGVSIGVVAISKGVETIESLMDLADNCCYIAKQKGRNQIHLYDDKHR